MPVRILGETGSPATESSATVCIVGAGFAGLIAATRLAKDRQRKVIVIESGLRAIDDKISTLNHVDNPADNYEGALTARCRALGGTSLLWSGKLLPITLHDTRPRPYLEMPGWPFDLAELESYRAEIETLMGVDRESYDEDISPSLDPKSLLSHNDPDFMLRWPKRPKNKNHNLAHIFRREIESLDNLEIWLGATVSGFEFDPASGKLLSLRAVNLAGQTLHVKADEFLIAAGTLESTRLLLLADRQSNQLLSRQGDALGRYFNDHLGWIPARLRLLKRSLTNQALGDRSIFDSLRHLHFELRPEVREQCGIGSAYFDTGAELPESSALTKSKLVLQSLKRGKLDFSLADLTAIFRDSPSLFWTVQWQVMRKQKYWPPNASLEIKIWVEQLPQWHNRICLSDQLDPLRLPMLRLEWTKGDAEEKAFRAMIAKIGPYWKRHLANICELDWKPEATRADFRIVDSSFDLAHPAGSTRMGTNPADSVVDTQLRVHQVPNLSVASASVFPTSGSANPTLTIMQLAMRAADAIAGRLANKSI